ncbi:hypothetical protein [Streptomyces sp. NPDC045470]|uniref:type II toxin-antitoxin system RelE family toxin n=1 Tax=unclassified Streptomyces TaxID=2593676 RepID=UPI0033DD40A5
MYKLRYEESVQAVWDSLPDEARNELDHAVLKICENPYEGTREIPGSGGVKRSRTLRHTRVIFVVFEAPIGRVRILRIESLNS